MRLMPYNEGGMPLMTPTPSSRRVDLNALHLISFFGRASLCLGRTGSVPRNLGSEQRPALTESNNESS